MMHPSDQPTQADTQKFLARSGLKEQPGLGMNARLASSFFHFLGNTYAFDALGKVWTSEKKVSLESWLVPLKDPPLWENAWN